MATGTRHAAAARGVDPRRASWDAAGLGGPGRIGPADPPAVARGPADRAGSLGRLRGRRGPADRTGVPIAAVVVGRAAVAGRSRPRAGGAAARRPAPARSRSRL